MKSNLNGIPPEYHWAIQSGYAQSGGAAPVAWCEADRQKLKSLEDVVASRLGVPSGGWGHGPGERLQSLEEFISSRLGGPPGDSWGHGPGERLRSLEEMLYSRFGSSTRG